MSKKQFSIPKLKGKVRDLVVVFGDQLDRNATPLQELDEEQDAVLMMEVDEESQHVWSHKQRTAIFLAAMRHFALDLADRDVRLQYVTLEDENNTHSFANEIKRAIKDLKPDRVRATLPGEWRVLQMLESVADDCDVELDILEDSHFYCTRDEFSEWASGRKQIVMEYFYREQRKKLDVLINKDGGPEGGDWNYDKENRETFKSKPEIANHYRARPDDITQEVIDLVNDRFADNPGTLDTLRWPVTAAEAKRALKDFIEHRLPNFGDYQDAMWTDEPFVYHSLLSAPINLKLLDPRDCVAAAIEAYEDGHAPLNCVEGFVRQLIGWREFIRGVYWHEGPDYENRNKLDQHGSLPQLYWDADTDMECMRQSVGQVVEHGYGHHIQRLMITGNFALLAGVHPKKISDWYLAMYVDAVDWVTLPNTLGMAMHADGGVVGTKPYAASGAYVSRMSNYCKNCKYNPKTRAGDDACPFTTFYWDFLIRNEERFSDNRRMTMMLKHVEKMDADERDDIQSHADRLRDKFGIEDTK